MAHKTVLKYLLFFSLIIIAHSQLFKLIPEDSEVAKLLRNAKSMSDAVGSYAGKQWQNLKENVKESTQSAKNIWNGLRGEAQRTLDSALNQFQKIQSDILNNERTKFNQQQYEEARDQLLEAIQEYYEDAMRKLKYAMLRVESSADPQQYRESLNAFQTAKNHFNEAIQRISEVKDKATFHWERFKDHALHEYDRVKQNVTGEVEKSFGFWQKIKQLFGFA